MCEMRIRKRQHPFLHGAAFVLTGGISGPVSAGMMGAKAARNRKADDEVEYLAAAMRGESASSVDDRALLASSKRVADEMKAQLAKARAEAAEAQHRARELSASSPPSAGPPSPRSAKGTSTDWGPRAKLLNCQVACASHANGSLLTMAKGRGMPGSSA